MDTNTQTAKSEIKNKIVTLFQIDKLPLEKQEEVVSKIGKIIFQTSIMRALPVLSEEKLAEYEKLVEDGVDVDALLDFLFREVPSFLQIIIEETENFRKDSVEMLKQMQ
ncbi:MAG: hypothetical protein WCX79_04040 [Candidatus Paceibacterota bacterium]|jgi:hypothetical protein